MGKIDAASHPLWRAAVASALGPLSAYLTPEAFGMSLIGFGESTRLDEAFGLEIRRRLDLGRAFAVAGVIEDLREDLPHSYRHSVYYSEDTLDGVLVVPRLVREIAAGRSRRIPVLRTTRFTETPEALFVSELIRTSARIASSWLRMEGAEGAYARRLAFRLSNLETQQPWAALRNRPKPSLRSLASSVKSRAVAGWTPRLGAFEKLADLVLGPSTSISPEPGPIAYLVSEDERYADRLFELVCLGWLLAGLHKLDPMGHIEPRALKGSGAPVFTGAFEDFEIRLHYQAGHFSRQSRYVWQHSFANLRAIPDYSIELKRGEWNRTILLDAKNRVLSSESEVIYKLLGYQENLGINPYLAIGIAPEYGQKSSLRGVRFAHRSAYLARIPLEQGKNYFERMLPRALRILSSS